MKAPVINHPLSRKWERVRVRVRARVAGMTMLNYSGTFKSS